MTGWGDAWKLLGVAAIAIPALLLLLTPWRWAGRVMLFWLFAPVLAYVAAIGWEMATRPPVNDHPLGTFLYGFMLISPLVAPIWLATCGLGFALGTVLRHVFRPVRAAPAQAAAVAPPAPAQRPSAVPEVVRPMTRPATPGWQAAHVGFAQDGLMLGGLDIWQLPWRQVPGPPINLPHPSHPRQIHDFTVYEVGEAPHTVRFAADELSNGVYGFYVPADPSAPRGTSADGSLRWTESLGPLVNGRYDAVAPWIVLTDARTGQVLLDCSGFVASTITPLPDGGLLLHLRGHRHDDLFRIDPATRRFRNVADAGPEEPLVVLAQAAETARRLDRVPYRRISPDAAIQVDLDPKEWSNTHWVHAPRVTDRATRRVVLDLWGSDADAGVTFPGPGRVRLDMRQYHRGGGMTVELDLRRGTYRISEETGGTGPLPDAPLAEVAAGVEAAGLRAGAAAAALHGRRPALPPNPFAAWRTALAILVAAMAVIGAATYLTMRNAPPHQQVLTPLPKFPVSR